MNKRLDKIGTVASIVLIIIYIPIMLFGFLAGFMASEGTYSYLGDPSFVQKATYVYIPSIIAIIGPLFTMFCMLYSVKLRKIGKSVAGFSVQFAPLAFYALFMLYISLL